MRWSRAFIELLLRFAAHAARVTGGSWDEALLLYTPLYLNFNLSRSFDPHDPVWQEFRDGYCHAADATTWTHTFYMAHPRAPMATPYGCFAYLLETEWRTIRIHFAARDTSCHGALSQERQVARRQELATMFSAIRDTIPQAEAVRGHSWMYNLAAYCRLFPTAYVQTAHAVVPEYQFMSLWGQFLDRHGALRPAHAQYLLERATGASTLPMLAESFPLRVRAPNCSIEHFYRFYGIN